MAKNLANASGNGSNQSCFIGSLGRSLGLAAPNGSVKLVMPDGYNAHFEARTVNGGMHFDFPVTVVGKIERDINTNLGNGGAPIRVQTTNGSVSLKRK